ncbi:MAG: hypothetical protein Q8M20_16815, partial [Rhodocyclaceae bacterium]|nr:hypothetical protein [Rhodocyclaceae bacterium]MDZ4214773.1 hypothetical protein [Rhodocyclaceae bacterium]
NGQNEHRNSGAREKTAQKQSFEAVLVRNLMSVQNQIAFEAVVPRFLSRRLPTFRSLHRAQRSRIHHEA